MMRSSRVNFAAVLYALVIGLCVLVVGRQVTSMTRLVVQRERPADPVPAFGEADIVYFSEPTCPACQITTPQMVTLQQRFPRYKVARVNTATPAGIALQEEYNRAYRVPARDQGRIPIVFAGDRYFLGVTAVGEHLPAYLSQAPVKRPASAARPQEGGAALLSQRFRSLSVLPVLAAGLVDSINPCAIASLVFFLSYLTLGGRQPRDLLWIGGLFTLGTFLTYFAMGLGLLHALRSLQFVPLVARGLYPLAALTMLVLALLSFRDYRRARRGDTAGISLQLPRGVKLKIHQVIRTRLGLPHLAAAAFTTAVLVAGLEFVCTSQVYVPTLMYMAQVGQDRWRAIGLLLLYNLMFVLPLIGLFTAAYLGVSTRSIARLAARHTATAKLAMSMLFVGFAVYLCTQSARMFGVS